jgi:hypothetical protein
MVAAAEIALGFRFMGSLPGRLNPSLRERAGSPSPLPADPGTAFGAAADRAGPGSAWSYSTVIVAKLGELAKRGRGGRR